MNQSRRNRQFSPLSRGMIPYVKPPCHVAEEEGRFIIYGVKGKAHSQVNDTSYLIWRLCTGEVSVGEIIDFLVEEYDESRKVIAYQVKQTLIKFMNHNLIVFSGRRQNETDDWRKTALSRKTYHINRGNVAPMILNEWGWKPAKKDEVAGFTLWNHRFSNPRVGIVEAYEGTETQQLDEKDLLAANLKQAGLEHFMPDSYESFDDFEQNSDFTEGQLWFVKEPGKCLGQGVYCFNTKIGIRNKTESLKTNYVIQKGVEDLLLLEEKKFSMRVFILIYGDLSTYVYEESLFKIQPKKYDSQILDRDVHILHNEAYRTSSDNYAFFKQLFPKICDVAKQTVDCVADQINFANEPNRFQILGVDFLTDQNLRPYLIEINDWPNIGFNPDIENERVDVFGIKKRMITDMFQLLFYEKPGRFVKVR